MDLYLLLEKDVWFTHVQGCRELVVVLFVIVVGTTFVVVVGFGRVHCLSDVGMAVVVVTIGSHCLFESAAHKVTIHGVQLQAVLCRGEAGRVVREIVFVSVNFGWSLEKLPVSWPVFLASDVTPFETNKSSALWVCAHSVVNSWLQFVFQFVLWYTA